MKNICGESITNNYIDINIESIKEKLIDLSVRVKILEQQEKNRVKFKEKIKQIIDLAVKIDRLEQQERAKVQFAKDLEKIINKK